MFEIGNSLREARERLELDLSQLEADTKIRAKYLRALEEERFDALPGESYARGFLEVYATRLGLNRQLYADEFDSRFAKGDGRAEGVRQVRADRRLRFEASALALGLLGILVVTVLVIAAWQFSGGGPEDAARSEPTAEPAPEPVAPPSTSPAPSVPPPPIETQPVETEPLAVVEDAELEVRALKPDARVTVRRHGPSGTVIFAGTLAAGEKRIFVGERLHAAFRKPNSVEVSVNAEPLPIVPRRLVATADGWRRG